MSARPSRASSRRTNARKTRSVAAVAALIVAVLVLLSAAATWSAGNPRARATHAPIQVAVVQSASAAQLSVKRKATGSISAFHAGDKIYLGDIVLAGHGATAKFKVTVPPGYSADTQLLYIEPVGHAHHTVTLLGVGMTTEVTLGT